jgi:hypothetical protein
MCRCAIVFKLCLHASATQERQLELCGGCRRRLAGAAQIEVRLFPPNDLPRSVSCPVAQAAVGQPAGILHQRAPHAQSAGAKGYAMHSGQTVGGAEGPGCTLPGACAYAVSSCALSLRYRTLGARAVAVNAESGVVQVDQRQRRQRERRQKSEHECPIHRARVRESERASHFLVLLEMQHNGSSSPSLTRGMLRTQGRVVKIAAASCT